MGIWEATCLEREPERQRHDRERNQQEHHRVPTAAERHVGAEQRPNLDFGVLLALDEAPLALLALRERWRW